ncbi:hypothetical protein EDC96DRAFT_523782 [Choanephora cucurbitarum]|nr:hypothetical protein EDC96DRAFT_523782 [Choanephora cucurbitarum]
MIAKLFTPSEQTLQEKPHLKSYLEELEELQKKFFENHPEEDKQKVQLYGVGRLAPQMIPMVKSVFVPLKIRRRRNRWQQYLHNSRKKGLHFRRPDDYKKIRRTYKDLVDKKAPELVELEKETQAFNCTVSQVSESSTSQLLANSIQQMKGFCKWLLSEFNTHVVIIYATDRTELPDVSEWYANSAVGEAFQTQVNSALRNRVAHAVFQRMVIRKDQDVAPVSTEKERISYGALECLQDLKVDSFESLDCRNRQYKKNDKIIHIPWVSLLSPNSESQSCLLCPWPRFPGDETNGRYRLNMADIETLRQMAIGLHNGSINVTACASPSFKGKHASSCKQIEIYKSYLALSGDYREYSQESFYLSWFKTR